MRHSLPNARIMIHQPSGGVHGQATDIKIQAEEILKLKAQINKLYGKHTGLSMEKIETSIERDKFMSPKEAKEFGLIDTILDSPPKHLRKPGSAEKFGAMSGSKSDDGSKTDNDPLQPSSTPPTSPPLKSTPLLDLDI